MFVGNLGLDREAALREVVGLLACALCGGGEFLLGECAALCTGGLCAEVLRHVPELAVRLQLVHFGTKLRKSGECTWADTTQIS